MTRAQPATESHQDIKPLSVGEELYLVHLQRKEQAERGDDQDHNNILKSPPRIGEELWQVHLKRSVGLEPDYDKEENLNKNHQKKIRVISDRKADDNKPCPYNLRNKKQ